MGGPILERDHELSALATAAREAALGLGSVALVFGEAGIGKSSLVNALRRHVPAGGRMLVGYCDDLATKRTLGPFRDLIGSVGTQLTRAVQDGGDRDQMLSALRAELRGPPIPTILVVEDVHWADEATLDALRLLISRVTTLPALILLTYRDDELTSGHPLRQLLGQAAGLEGVRRLPLRRLSPDAVRAFSAGSSVDADRLYAATSGNPFFVSEVLASGTGEGVPPTIVEAVLARVRPLDPATREALEQLAVIPSTLDPSLVDQLVPGGPAALLTAEERGLLTVSPRQVSFRHELTRHAIADSLPNARRMELNRRVLTALVAQEGRDVSQIVHHAAEAGDLDSIARYGPEAAREAARAGAHREAAAHFRLVLEHPRRFSAGERADLLEEYAVECYTIGAAHRAVGAQRDAVRLRRSFGDALALGAALRWLSRMHWWAGEREAAERAAEEAIAVLDTTGDAALRALAYSNQSQLHMLADRAGESIALGERAAALAREAGDASTLSHALTNIGSSRCRLGDRGGYSILDEALRVGLGAGDVENACRTYVGIVWSLLDEFRLDEAEHYLTAAADLAEDAEFLGFLTYLRVERARLTLARGCWDDAIRAAEQALGAQAPMRCPALTVLGRVRVRRGEPGADETLAQAWDLAVEMAELQRTGPVTAARAEAAWLRGDLASVRAIVRPVHDEARRLNQVYHQAELGHWLVKAGDRVSIPDSDHPYALLARGNWREAAAAWRSAGCPYEHAAAMTESRDPDDLLRCLAELDALGAVPLAAKVRARLRESGVSRIPRGPYRAARGNPAGLTARQVQVLRLLSAGRTNAEIANRLVISVRTVDTHVAAILDKVGADGRRDAAARAVKLGIVELGIVDGRVRLDNSDTLETR